MIYIPNRRGDGKTAKGEPVRGHDTIFIPTRFCYSSPTVERKSDRNMILRFTWEEEAIEVRRQRLYTNILQKNVISNRIIDALEAPYTILPGYRVRYRVRDIEIERNLTLDTPSRSWWNSAGTVKFLRAPQLFIIGITPEHPIEELWSKIPGFRGSSLFYRAWRPAFRVVRAASNVGSFGTRQSSDPSRKPVAKSLGYAYKLNPSAEYPHDFAVISRNEQSKIVLLSTFFTLTRHRKRIIAYSKIHVIRIDLAH